MRRGHIVTLPGALIIPGVGIVTVLLCGSRFNYSSFKLPIVSR